MPPATWEAAFTGSAPERGRALQLKNGCDASGTDDVDVAQEGRGQGFGRRSHRQRAGRAPRDQLLRNASDGPEAPARRSGVRVDGVSHSLPFSDLLALTSSDMFLSVNVLIITVRMRSWLR